MGKNKKRQAKKLAVTGDRMGTMETTRQRQGSRRILLKRNNISNKKERKLKIATWNVRGLGQTGAVMSLVHEAIK